jgi:hypothetical protein
VGGSRRVGTILDAETRIWTRTPPRSIIDGAAPAWGPGQPVLAHDLARSAAADLLDCHVGPGPDGVAMWCTYEKQDVYQDAF